MDYKEELYLIHIMQQTYSSLYSVSNKLQIAADNYYEDITSRQFMTMLAVLHLSEDERTYINIAKKLGTSKQNISQIIKSLEKKNYVYVSPSKKDKRAVNVFITEDGMKAVEKCGGDAGIYFMADIFKNLSKEEIETLGSLLNKLYSFDGSMMDGLEQDVNAPNINSEEIKGLLEKFHERRNKCL